MHLKMYASCLFVNWMTCSTVVVSLATVSDTVMLL